PDTDQLPGDSVGEPAHPSGRLHAARAADVRLDVLHLLRLARGDADARGDPLPRRAGRDAAGLAPARAAGPAGAMLAVTAAEEYVAAACGVAFLVGLVSVLIIAVLLR